MGRTLEVAALCVLLCGAFSPSVGQAASLVAQTVESLAGKSDLVVRAVVVDRAVQLDAEGTPWTIHTLAVSRSWGAEAPATVELWQRGGPLPDGSVIVIPGDLQLQLGDDVVAFLQRTGDGRLFSVALGWSVFHVAADGRLDRHQDDFGLFAQGEQGLRPLRPGEITPPRTLAELDRRLAPASPTAEAGR